MSRKLIREELIKVGYVVDHESPTMSVLTKPGAHKRIVLTPGGKWFLYRKSIAGPWLRILSGEDFSQLLSTLRS